MVESRDSVTEPLVRPPHELADYFQIRKDVVYLNHGSFGACPRPVMDVYQNWQRELEMQPVDFFGRRLPTLLRDARGVLGTFLGTSGDNLVFVPNTTYGINVIARSLDLQSGDEVLSTNHEYGAVDRTWRFNCTQKRARYINHPVSVPVVDADAVVDELWAGVTERTRVIVISHISSFTALIFPVAEVCRRAREAGILTVIDGAHAPGHIDLQLDAIGADFYVGNCHKWLCAPKGSAFLYARQERQELLHPLVVSWGWESASPGPSRFIDHFDWVGTADPSAYLSVPAAIAFQAEHNWASVRSACHDLVDYARERMTDLTGLPQISPSSTQWWGQMCSMPLPIRDAAWFGKRLWEDYRIEIPVIPWRDHVFLRISIQAYNTQAHVDVLVDAVGQLIGESRSAEHTA